MSQIRDIHPTDEDLSVGTWGTQRAALRFRERSPGSNDLCGDQLKDFNGQLRLGLHRVLEIVASDESNVGTFASGCG